MSYLYSYKQWAEEHPDIVKQHALPFVKEGKVESVAEEDDAAPFFEDTDEAVLQEPETKQLPINEWSVADWKKVPGVGVTLAMRIVSNGPYQDIEDLRRVKGVSDKVVNSLNELLV